MVRTEENKTEKIERHTELMTAQMMGLDLYAVKKYRYGQVYMQGEATPVPDINKALSEAGGKPEREKLWEMHKNKGGKAQPEYIVTFDNDDSTIIVVECKSKTSLHDSGTSCSPKRYAEDGVLYYAKYLKDYFNVIAVAVSGTDSSEYLTSAFYWEKKGYEPLILPDARYGIMKPEDYLHLATNCQNS